MVHYVYNTLHLTSLFQILLKLMDDTESTDMRVHYSVLCCLLELSSKLGEKLAQSTSPAMGLADRVTLSS